VLLELLANALHFVVLRRLGTAVLLGISLISALWLVYAAPHMNVGGQMNRPDLGAARVLFSYCLGISLWRWRGDRALVPGWLGIIALPVAVIALGAAPSAAHWLDFAFVFALSPVIVASGLAPLPFARRPLVWLGAISFPLYAVHFPVALLLSKAGFGIAGTLPFVLAIAALITQFGELRQRPPVLSPA
jgi:peptidoglycan/LPS O-acetylase OafA/YrhL